jgi:hypothetical protein
MQGVALVTQRLSKIYWYLCSAIYLIWSLWLLTIVRADEFLFGLIATTLFFFVYLLPITVFGAKINVTSTGLQVLQYGEQFVSFSEIRSCHSIFLVPLRLVMVRTSHRFPRNILISGDRAVAKGRSLRKDGELASRIKTSLKARKESPS